MAAFMQTNRLKQAVAVINNKPCGPCTDLLPRMMPKGSVLEIYGPDQYYFVFFGTGRVR